MSLCERERMRSPWKRGRALNHGYTRNNLHLKRRSEKTDSRCFSDIEERKKRKKSREREERKVKIWGFHAIDDLKEDPRKRNSLLHLLRCCRRCLSIYSNIRRYKMLTSRCQTILGLGKPVALQANFTVEDLRTLNLLAGFNKVTRGGTGKKEKRKRKCLFFDLREGRRKL